ncbi:MAG: AAA family ATPase [Arachnia sp.]
MLLFLFGPPAVGKMTVGRAVCARTGFRLFHNHMTIEPLVETFGHGSPQFNVLNEEFRRRVLEEAAAGGIDLLFTIVWGLDLAEDLELTKNNIAIFDGDVAFVELRADLDTRLNRNHTPERLADKRSKRDLAWSDENVRSMDVHLMTSVRPSIADELLQAYPHLVVDNTHLTPDEAADRIAAWVATLPRPSSAAAEHR